MESSLRWRLMPTRESLENIAHRFRSGFVPNKCGAGTQKRAHYFRFFFRFFRNLELLLELRENWYQAEIDAYTLTCIRLYHLIQTQWTVSWHVSSVARWNYVESVYRIRLIWLNQQQEKRYTPSAWTRNWIYNCISKHICSFRITRSVCVSIRAIASTKRLVSICLCRHAYKL